jgi:hypothetical protein
MILQREVLLQDRTVQTVEVPEWFGYDPVAQRYEAFFEYLDWTKVPERDESRQWPGRLPHPETAYIKAYLVMICEGKEYMTDLRRYLIEHPPLVWLLGFRVKPDRVSPYGFDIEASVPTDRHLRRKLRKLNERMLAALLVDTVAVLSAKIPGLGETVSLDTKHIYAYVKENNPRAYVKERFDPTKQPAGDPDCRLGVKRSTNQTDDAGNTTTEKEYLWGYGTGVAVTRTSEGDEVVLGEYTQTFNANDVTYGLPLLEQARMNLGRPPRNITADAAFDAWYMYQGCAEVGGIAAIALNLRSHPPTFFGLNDYPLCACNAQEMQPGPVYLKDTYREQLFVCSACGTTRHLNIEPGGLMRLQLDRQADAYKLIYKQRTATERINSQAKALGIERPKLRNGASIAHRNTLIYVVINMKALQRIHKRKRDPTLLRRAA